MNFCKEPAENDNMSHMGKAEGGFRPPSEYRIGTRVFILQHRCIPDRLGSFGNIDEMQGSVPITAKCEDCGRSVGVNLKAMQDLQQPKKPKA